MSEQPVITEEGQAEVDEINRIKKFIKDLKADELKAEIDFLYPNL